MAQARIFAALLALMAMVAAADVLAACGGGRGMGHHGRQHAMSRMPAAMSQASLPEADSEGARNFARVCSQCHGLPSPAAHRADEWPSVIARMNARMQRGWLGARAPAAEDLESLTGYLKRHSAPAASERSVGHAEFAEEPRS